MMFILTKCDAVTGDEDVIGVSDTFKTAINKAELLANEVRESHLLNNIYTGGVVVDGNSIFYKTNDNVVLAAWLIYEVPTLII